MNKTDARSGCVTAAAMTLGLILPTLSCAQTTPPVASEPAVAIRKDAAPDPTPPGQWKVLFDGKTLTGMVVDQPAQAKNVTIGDGVIRILGSRDGGWLRTERKYGDFTAQMEIRFLENKEPLGGGPYGNNGLILRSPEVSISGRNWPGRGFEMELWDQSKRDGFAKNGQILALQPGAPGSEFTFDIGAAQRAYRPTGQWNQVEVIAHGNRLWTKLNGEWLGFTADAVHPDGHIGFQIEDGITEIRNVRIMEHTPDTWTPATRTPLFKNGELKGMSVSDPAHAAKVSIKDGVLRLAGPGGWLKTDAKYTSYTLRLDFRTMTDSANGGVYLRVGGDKADTSGFALNTDKVQFLSQRNPPPTGAAGDARWFGAFLSRGTPGGRATIDTGRVLDAWRGNGEWQQATLAVDGRRVTVTLNGIVIAEGDNVANLETGGFVGLEIGAGVTEFRQIEIEGYRKD